jgi:hypothetical protein
MGTFLICAAVNVGGTSARAQIIEIPELELPVTTEFDRGRNQSVLDRPRPEWDPVAIRAGAFMIYPYAEARLGITDNVFESTIEKKSDAFVRVTSGVSVNSIWSRHSLSFAANGDFHRFFEATERNENGWSLALRGQLDVSDAMLFRVSAETAQRYESRLSGAAVPDARTSAQFQQTTLRAVADLRVNRLRIVGFGNYTDLAFDPLTLANGERVAQDSRDREIIRAGSRLEYGLTPDTGLFVLASYATTDYPGNLPTGIANRDSHETRILGGVTTDLADLVRASFGAGYVDRVFRAPIYSDIKGLTVQAKVEYFPTKLTTVTLSGRREVEDATIASGGFFDTGGTLRVDHELLRNLILSAAADYAVEDFVGIEARAEVFRTGIASRYLASRNLELGADINASERWTEFGADASSRLSEIRATISLRLKL